MMNNIMTPFFVPIQISQVVLDYARKFAAEQTTAEKAKKVYENTVAVGAVASYLDWMEFKTDLGQGESWNAASRYFNDVADLVLPEIGSIECRSLLPGETEIYLPPEATENRIGCALVRLEEEADKVKILGFVPADDEGNLPEVVKVEDLQSLEELTELLGELEFQGEMAARKKTKKTINLGKWLENIVDETWRTVQEVLGEERARLVLGTARRGGSSQGVVRAESIHLGTSTTGISLALVVGVVPTKSKKIKVVLLVHPTSIPYLPAGLKFAAMDASGKIMTKETAGDNRKFLGLKVSGITGEEFSMEVELDGNSVTKKFVI